MCLTVSRETVSPEETEQRYHHKAKVPSCVQSLIENSLKILYVSCNKQS